MATLGDRARRVQSAKSRKTAFIFLAVVGALVGQTYAAWSTGKDGGFF